MPSTAVVMIFLISLAMAQFAAPDELMGFRNKCSMSNSSNPCKAGFECLPKATCVLVNAVSTTPQPREFYCTCANGCSNCLNESECTANSRCSWDGGCYDNCRGTDCMSCEETGCTLRSDCFWSKQTTTCHPQQCARYVCQCETSSACEAIDGCIWTDGLCRIGDDVVYEAVGSVFDVPSEEINFRRDCQNSSFDWYSYKPPEALLRDCEEGVCAACSLGRYCPVGSTNPNFTLSVCPPLFYCPNPATILPCPAGSFCLQATVVPFNCTAGRYCPLNTSTPNGDWCPKGYYCPTASEKLRCPAGSYCIQGLTTPQECPFGSTCAEGTSNPDRSALLGITLALLILLFTAVMAITWARYVLGKREATKNLEARQERGQVISEFLNALDVPIDTLPLKGFEGRSSPPATIAFEDLSLRVGSRVILQGVTGEFPQSSLVAIMGPSGAGKTSFLNVLTGKAHYGKVGGHIKVNGHEGLLANITPEVGFVPQDDTVLDFLTVRDNIYWSAFLRLPSEWDTARKSLIVEDVISVLGLSHIQHSIVGSVEKRGISGGQRKRVNIGMELAAYPTILFLDEPTSGLDASTTQDLLQRLRQFSRLGISISAVIHQPRYSAFMAFDYILLLGVGGRTVYLGSSAGAISYFQSIGFSCPPRENPSDFFLDVISGLIPCELTASFKSSDLFEYWISRNWRDATLPIESRMSNQIQGFFEKIDTDGDGHLDAKELEDFFQSMGGKASKESLDKILGATKTRGISLDELMSQTRRRSITQTTDFIPVRTVPGVLRQWLLLFWRDLVRVVREVKAVTFNCFLLAAAGTLLGVLYGGNWDLTQLPQISMALATFASLFGGLLAIDLLAPERLLNLRERSVGVNQHAYFLSKLVLNFMFCVLHTACILLVFYPLINLPFSYGLLYEWVFLCIYNASGIGLLVSVFHKGPHVFVGIALTMLNLFLGGVLVTPKTLGNGAGLTYLSPARWLSELITTYALRALPPQRETERLLIEDRFSMSYEDRDLAVLVLAALGSGYRVLAYIAHLSFDPLKNQTQSMGCEGITSAVKNCLSMKNCCRRETS